MHPLFVDNLYFLLIYTKYLVLLFAYDEMRTKTCRLPVILLFGVAGENRSTEAIFIMRIFFRKRKKYWWVGAIRTNRLEFLIISMIIRITLNFSSFLNYSFVSGWRKLETQSWNYRLSYLSGWLWWQVFIRPRRIATFSYLSIHAISQGWSIEWTISDTRDSNHSFFTSLPLWLPFLNRTFIWVISHAFPFLVLFGTTSCTIHNHCISSMEHHELQTKYT